MSELTQLFTDIANAIRTNKGTIAKIPAKNFPKEIETCGDKLIKKYTITNSTTSTVEFTGLDIKPGEVYYITVAYPSSLKLSNNIYGLSIVADSKYYFNAGYNIDYEYGDTASRKSGDWISCGTDMAFIVLYCVPIATDSTAIKYLAVSGQSERYIYGGGFAFRQNTSGYSYPAHITGINFRYNYNKDTYYFQPGMEISLYKKKDGLTYL